MTEGERQGCVHVKLALTSLIFPLTVSRRCHGPDCRQTDPAGPYKERGPPEQNLRRLQQPQSTMGLCEVQLCSQEFMRVASSRHLELVSQFSFAFNALATIVVMEFISGACIIVLLVGICFTIHSCSFVRSVSMDTWSDEQIKRMQVRLKGCLWLRYILKLVI